MPHSLLSAIAAMATTSASTLEDHTLRRPARPVVTISRDYGSGGDVIATRLAQRLDVPLYDTQLLKDVAERLQDDPAIIRLLDESFGRAKDMWLYRFLSGKDVGPDAYRDSLAKVILSLGRMGGVVLGRGGHVVLQDACALRVRITGTPDVCAARMTAQGHGTYQEELTKARDLNHQRGKFVWDVFHARLSDASQFDVVLNTDRMADFEDAVEMLHLMARAIHGGRVLS